ncbi:hypothetical protein DL89DRAFT_265194 [Linderina pennispora]|uniref:RGS domain-containing protein n=1 Tax=Linderina pennispora TaxID=61395 RepID=A0A1Y1WI41_9FUNG|nr:uncharacterized protein DL89DRAFT_265194 [Linderina pennispora]ORX73035.1 hypothetical protein DL89DRAFT_265194 [Linderina pennispora]
MVNKPVPWDDDPASVMSGSQMKTREIVTFTIMGVYIVFVVTTLVMFLRRSLRQRETELVNRSVALVTTQAVGCLLAGLLGLISTAVTLYPCAIKLWLFNIGLSLIVLSLTARSAQLIVTSRTHEIKSKLSTITNVPVAPTAIPLSWAAEFDALPAQYDSVFGAFGSDDKFELGGMENSGQLQEADSLQHYVSDKALMMYIAIAMVLIVILTVVINVLSDDFSINPTSISCVAAWGYYPVIGLLATFLVFLCPVLLIKVWRLEDAYGIRNDLFICVCFDVANLTLALVWETKLAAPRLIVSGLFFIWVSATAKHVVSVVVPLVRAHRLAKRSSNELVVEQHQTLETPRSSVLGKKSHPNIVVGTKRRDFEMLLDDDFQYDRFRSFAASCFCAELVAFLDDYQMLKAVTLTALESSSLMSGADTPEYQSSIDDGHVHSSGHTLSSAKGNGGGRFSGGFGGKSKQARNQPLKLRTNAVVSILEAARLAFPTYRLSPSTEFPASVQDRFVLFVSKFIRPESLMTVNIPGAIIQDIYAHLNRRELASDHPRSRQGRGDEVSSVARSPSPTPAAFVRMPLDQFFLLDAPSDDPPCRLWPRQ